MNSFILASASPQRKQILTQLGISFEAVPADIDESFAEKILKRPHAIAKAIALKKAETVARQHSDQWVIGSDTLVVSKAGRVLGKPKNRKDAEQMIRSFSGTYCDVYSGVALVKVESKKAGSFLRHLDYSKTRLHFHAFSEKNLKAYLDSGEWEGKAGALMIERAGDWLSKMEGEYWNVVGLPVEKLKRVIFNLIRAFPQKS